MAPPDPPPPPERWLRPRMRFMFILLPSSFPIVGGPGECRAPDMGFPGSSLVQPRSIGVDGDTRRTLNSAFAIQGAAMPHPCHLVTVHASRGPAKQFFRDLPRQDDSAGCFRQIQAK